MCTRKNEKLYGRTEQRAMTAAGSAFTRVGKSRLYTLRGECIYIHIIYIHFTKSARKFCARAHNTVCFCFRLFFLFSSTFVKTTELEKSTLALACARRRPVTCTRARDGKKEKEKKHFRCITYVIAVFGPAAPSARPPFTIIIDGTVSRFT